MLSHHLSILYRKNLWVSFFCLAKLFLFYLKNLQWLKLSLQFAKMDQSYAKLCVYEGYLDL